MIYTLTDVNGKQTLLQLDETVAKKLGGVLQFNRKYVSAQGTWATPSGTGATLGSTQSPSAVLNVISISLAPSPRSQAPVINGVTAFPVVSGSHPWVTIMCQFSDIATQPHNRAYFVGMYGNTQPGLDHYWRELSFNTANVTGSDVAGTGWYVINTLATYNPGLCSNCTGSAGLTALFNDCTAAADPDVDFSQFDGINLMFNTDYDFGWAWGGSMTATLDGVTKTWSVTWEPPWGYADISVITHEMGHGFGLPHSTAIMRDPDNTAPVYDNAWDVMSWDRYNCAAGSPFRDATYGCMAQHTISYHKDLLGWIPAARKTTVATGASATVTLEDLAAPASANSQMAIIPIGGSTTNFYTVEARRFTGYDAKLPAEAVIIHDVDTTERIPALLVPSGLSSTDPGVMFIAGETFTDATNKIRVTVDSANSTASVVTILNGIEPPTSKAGGPYTQECTGPITTVRLDGSGSSDPEGSALTYAWSTNCPGGTFDNPTIVNPTLTVNSLTGCPEICSVTLKVTDNQGLSGSDSATVTIKDTTPPTLSGVPSDQTVQCDAVPRPASVTATDICDPSVTAAFAETRVNGSCAGNYTLTRTWTGLDDCGNKTSAAQTITVQDTVGPVISCNSPATMTPPDAPTAFTATATDNCSSATAQITGYNCVGKDGKSRLESCVVALSESTIRILNSGGVDDTITWTVQSADGCGNTTSQTCSIRVVNPGQGH